VAAARRTQCIIFSDWDDALWIADAALKKNGVRTLRLGTPADIETKLGRFKRDDGITALLLRYGMGAEGLNITQANHVFFLDPALEPATEAQAIGRVYRMGQTRRTYVHRLIAAGTIEEVVVAVNHSRQRTATSTGVGAGAGAGAGAASSSFSPLLPSGATSPGGSSGAAGAAGAAAASAEAGIGPRAVDESVSVWLDRLTVSQLSEHGILASKAQLAGALEVYRAGAAPFTAPASLRAAGALSRGHVLKLLERFVEA